MINNVDGLRVTMEQMERLIRALDDLKKNVLLKNLEIFATMAEAPLDDLDRLRKEVNGYVHELKPTT